MTESNIKESQKSLSNKIYKTRKARIIFSDELKSQHSFYEGLMTYYTVMIIVFSLLESVISIENFSLYILILSIALGFFTLFIQSQKFLERHLDLKKHYIDLENIYFNLNVIETPTKDAIEKINREYTDALNSHENHSSIHYLKAQYNISDISFPDKIKVWFYNLKSYLFRFALIIFPFFVPKLIIWVKLIFIEKS